MKSTTIIKSTILLTLLTLLPTTLALPDTEITRLIEATLYPNPEKFRYDQSDGFPWLTYGTRMTNYLPIHTFPRCIVTGENGTVHECGVYKGRDDGAFICFERPENADVYRMMPVQFHADTKPCSFSQKEETLTQGEVEQVAPDLVEKPLQAVVPRAVVFRG